MLTPLWNRKSKKITEELDSLHCTHPWSTFFPHKKGTGNSSSIPLGESAALCHGWAAHWKGFLRWNCSCPHSWRAGNGKGKRSSDCTWLHSWFLTGPILLPHLLKCFSALEGWDSWNRTTIPKTAVTLVDPASIPYTILDQGMEVSERCYPLQSTMSTISNQATKDHKV